MLNLAGDLGQEYDHRLQEGSQDLKNIHSLTDHLVPNLFDNGDDISAVDLLLDTEQLPKLHKFIG